MPPSWQHPHPNTPLLAFFQKRTVGQNTNKRGCHKSVGIGISLFIHAVAVCSVVIMSSALSSFKPPLRIDFNIHEPYEVTKAEKLTNKIAPAQKSVAARGQQVAPPQKMLPEKVQVTIPKKNAPLLTKKKILTGIPAPEVKKEVIQKSVPEPLQSLTKILPEQVISSADSGTDDFVKEHFLYIKNTIQNRISYPRMVRKMGWQGKDLISFTICMDGSVENIRIIESSGCKALDKHAVEVIQKVAPFPKPPVSAELIIPVIYKLG